MPNPHQLCHHHHCPRHLWFLRQFFRHSHYQFRHPDVVFWLFVCTEWMDIMFFPNFDLIMITYLTGKLVTSNLTSSKSSSILPSPSLSLPSLTSSSILPSQSLSNPSPGRRCLLLRHYNFMMTALINLMNNWLIFAIIYELWILPVANPHQFCHHHHYPCHLWFLHQYFHHNHYQCHPQVVASSVYTTLVNMGLVISTKLSNSVDYTTEY